jgi:polar amino acid transport system substrate-binding protein
MNISIQSVLELTQQTRRSRRRVFRTVLGLSAIFLACVTLAAEKSAGESGVLRVGISPVFPPMAFKQGKELAGVEVDLARALGEKLGRRVVFVETEWKDQTEALVSGKTDIIMSSMSVTMARSSVMSFTRPYFKVGQMALVRREDREQHSLGWRVAPGTKVGLIKATTGDFLIQREFPKAKRKYYDTGEDAARALKRGSVDLFISDSTLVWRLAGTHAADNLAAVPAVMTEEVLAWAVRRGDDTLLAAANEFIERAIQDGSLLKVFRRWMAVE